MRTGSVKEHGSVVKGLRFGAICELKESVIWQSTLALDIWTVYMAVLRATPPVPCLECVNSNV